MTNTTDSAVYLLSLKVDDENIPEEPKNDNKLESQQIQGIDDIDIKNLREPQHASIPSGHLDGIATMDKTILGGNLPQSSDNHLKKYVVSSITPINEVEEPDAAVEQHKPECLPESEVTHPEDVPQEVILNSVEEVSDYKTDENFTEEFVKENAKKNCQLKTKASRKLFIKEGNKEIDDKVENVMMMNDDGKIHNETYCRDWLECNNNNNVSQQDVQSDLKSNASKCETENDISNETSFTGITSVSHSLPVVPQKKNHFCPLWQIKNQIHKSQQRKFSITFKSITIFSFLNAIVLTDYKGSPSVISIFMIILIGNHIGKICTEMLL